MKTLVILFSILLNFATSAEASEVDVAAANIYANFKAIQIAAQQYRAANSSSYAGISISSLCTTGNISGVCGASNDGYYKAGSYSVTKGATNNKIVIKLNKVPDPIGTLVSNQYTKDHLCNGQYQAGVVTVTCNAPF